MNLRFDVRGQDSGLQVRMRATTRHSQASLASGVDYNRMVQGLQKRLREVTSGPTLATRPHQPGADLNQALFDNAVTIKVASSKLSMHLSQRYRSQLFEEVDRLLDIDNWDDDSTLIDDRSFQTFLRAILYNRIGKIPSLGVSQGRLLASWHNHDASQRLYVEFLIDDRVKVILTTAGQTKESDEAAALMVPSRRLRERLSGLGIDPAVFDAA
jgi:hypothetical protein